MPSQQVDLFLDSLINAPVKDDRALMEFPFFSLSKTPRHEPIEYRDANATIRITAGEKGIATIWDKDVLIYIASLINDRVERGLPVDRTIKFAGYDLLRVTRRVKKSAGKTDYEALKDTLFRLRSTTITTDIQSDGDAEDRGFGWISDYRIVRRTDSAGKRVMECVEVVLSDWMYRAIARERRVLTINPDYFELTKGLERRLYELARKHCGRQKRWVISLAKLAEKCGTTQELRFFKRDLKAIIEADNLPDYQLDMVFDPAEKKEREREGLPSRRWGSNERILVAFWPRSRLPDSLLDDGPGDA